MDGAEAYKVVRSSNETVTWPLGDGDTLVGVVGMDGKTRLVDDGAPADGTSWYRVFCVRLTDDGYQVLAASKARGIESTEPTPKPTEKPKPTPAPVALWIEVGADGGAIVLHWEACDSDVFSHYRILRKTDGGEASLLTEVGERDATTYVDDSAEPGVTYRYLVEAKGHVGDDWILLGSTAWATGSVD